MPRDVPNRSATSRFLYGARFPLQGLQALVHTPSLWPWAGAPVALALVLLLLALGLTVALTPALAEWLVPAAPTPLVASLRDALILTLGLFLLAASVLILYGSIGILGTPFYDRLSQRVEDEARGGAVESFAWGIFAADVTRSAWHSALSLAVWAGVMVALLVLNLVPVIGSVLNVVASLLATSLFAAREMMDGTLSRRRLSYGEKLDFIRSHLAESLGFGAVTGLAMAVPVVNILALPACIAAGTLLVLDLEQER